MDGPLLFFDFNNQLRNQILTSWHYLDVTSMLSYHITIVIHIANARYSKQRNVGVNSIDPS